MDSDEGGFSTTGATSARSAGGLSQDWSLAAERWDAQNHDREDNGRLSADRAPVRNIDHLIQATARGDKAQFAELFVAVAPRLKASFLRSGAAAHDAEKRALQTMVAVWKRAVTFDAEAIDGWRWISNLVCTVKIGEAENLGCWRARRD